MQASANNSLIFETNSIVNLYKPNKKTTDLGSIEYLVPNNLERESIEGNISPIETRDRSGISKSHSNTIHEPFHRLPISQKNLKSYTENFENPVSIVTTLLSRMHNSLRLTKSVINHIKHGDKFEKTVINIYDTPLQSDSYKDVLPALLRIDIPKSQNMNYKFLYKNPYDKVDPIWEYWKYRREAIMLKYEYLSFYNTFSVLTQRYSRKESFLMLFPYTSDMVKVQKTFDYAADVVKGESSVADVDPGSDFKDFKDFYSEMMYRIWHKGIWGMYQKVTSPLRKVVQSNYFNFLMTVCVVANTIVLSLDHYGISANMDFILVSLNNAFTNVFIAEMGMKILGIGIVAYCRDIMNYFDGGVVILSIIENIYLNRTKSAFTAFRVVRIFRILRVLRIARLFRYLRSMTHILHILGKSMSKFIYLFLLLMLFLCIYSLIAMQVFGGKFSFPQGKPRSNFDGFHWSFITTFQVLSMENWQSILYDSMRSTVGYSSCLFLISWIILGNYVFLNLFLAILLDSFSEASNNESKNEGSILLSNNSKKKKNREEKMRIIENMNSESDDDEFITTIIERKPPLQSGFQGKSYFIFSENNAFRKLCIIIYTSKHFEVFILILISITSLKLAFDTYLINSSAKVQDVSAKIDMAFTSMYLGEFIIKSVSLGLVLGKKSYLHDYWNYIDFAIVVASIIDFSISSINISQIKIVRLLRTLRPLRYISHNLSMKIVVTALLESLIAIMNVAVVLVIIWLMFAILAISLFGGKLYSCTNSLLITMTECISAGYKWEAYSPNYDNVINAMISLFILSSEEGWPIIMDQAIDGKDIGQAPSLNYNQYAAYYFVVFIMVSSFFFMNLFIAVVFEKFTEARNNQSSLAASILTKEQMLWIELQHLIVKSTPNIDFSSKPKNAFRGLMYNISKNVWFKISVILVIMLNMIQMALVYDGATKEYTSALDTLNLAFTCFFILEAFIKIIGIGFNNYFQSNSNKFDMFVVLTSILDLVLTNSLNSTISLLRMGPQLIRIIRVLRVSRLVRLFKSLNSLKNLIDVIGYSLPAIANVLSLLFLIFFIYAVVGVNLFGTVMTGNIIGPFTNFNNFGNAMILLLRCSTGEDWFNIMYDCNKAQDMAVCAVFFISFITITTFIMLNLFIMVIIQNYEEHEGNPESVLRIFTKEVRKIKMFWSIYAKKSDGIRVHYNELVPLMQELEELGITKDMETDQVLRILRFTELHPDNSGYVYYNDFLYAILKKKYIKRANTTYYRKLVANEEAKTKKEINKIIAKERKKIEKESCIQLVASGNFFLRTMYLRSIFKNWKGYAIKRIEKRGNCKRSLSITPAYSECIDPGMNSYKSEIDQDKESLISE
ncbi:hypothetical protein SteCoe_30075 [Stentor coeruleus]|uniref:Ion transport domain-containing protein n=1 Tax=Stentor coeruleus TaxID=5963 RepID=A0A1R2B4Q3_9CILI|nr:hypothetical protein SteCoe_30075 [Stentor coeruleus]